MFNFVAIKGDTVTNAREFYDKSNGSLSAVIIIPRNIDSTGVVNIYSEETISHALESTIERALADTIKNAHLAAMGIPNLQQIVDKASVDIDVHAIKWSETGDEKERRMTGGGERRKGAARRAPCKTRMGRRKDRVREEVGRGWMGPTPGMTTYTVALSSWAQRGALLRGTRTAGQGGKT